MRYDSGQFGAFDGRDNRKELVILFQRLGQHLPEVMANEHRANWLKKLIKHSLGPWAAATLQIDPCCALEAYNLCVAICGVLDVPINEAAKLLDETVRRQCSSSTTAS